MGVMLALDRPRPPRSRGHGQHARPADDQARADALVAFLRYDAPGRDRRLGRLARVMRCRRLLPAAVALAEAVGAVLTEDSSGPGGTPAA
jgi:hypothetical protein